MSTWDVVVVGAGPAGSMTALEVARAGASVLLVDREAHPRWKVCGACLSPGTQEILEEAGLRKLLERARVAPLDVLRLAGWGSAASVPLGGTVALARATLDHALLRAAAGAGASIAAPARARLGPVGGDRRVVHLDAEDLRTEVRAHVVVAADGLGSPILAEALAEAGLGEAPTGRADPSSRVGLGGVFDAHGDGVSPGAYPPGAVHMAVGEEGYVGLVRLGDGALNVAAALDPGALRNQPPHVAVNRVLEQAGRPPFAAPPETGWRGTPKLTRRPAARAAGRVFAVGDAAGYVEPFTGEGIAWALAGARELAPILMEASRGWRPELAGRWDAVHEAVVGRSARICRGVAWALRRAHLSRAVIELLRHVPGAAAPVVRWTGAPPGGGPRRTA